MKRTLMQVYVKGSAEAVELYKQAFDAKLVEAFQNEDGTYGHAELDVYGQIVAVSEARGRKAGNNMQFCLQFDPDEKDKVTKAYEVLKQGAKKAYPLDSCAWSPYVAGVVDKYGVNWCIYVTE
jgi:PhnB protein